MFFPVPANTTHLMRYFCSAAVPLGDLPRDLDISRSCPETTHRRRGSTGPRATSLIRIVREPEDLGKATARAVYPNLHSLCGQAQQLAGGLLRQAFEGRQDQWFLEPDG